MGDVFQFQPNSNRIFCKQLNSGDPDQTPQNVVSDLGLHCLHISHKKEARLIGVKESEFLEKLNLYF